MGEVKDARQAAKLRASHQRIHRAERNADIMNLYAAGASCDAIAKKVNLSPSGVWRAIQSELNRILIPPAQDVIKVELKRLDSIIMANWQNTMAGDDKAAGIVLKAQERRAKYLGLDDYERRMAEVAEKRLELDERQGQLMAIAVAQILDQLDLTADQRRRAQEVAPRELRKLEA